MPVVASIQVTQQIGPDDWVTGPRTKVFSDQAPLASVLDWARTHSKGMQYHDIKLSAAE